MLAAERFAAGQEPAQVAGELRVTERSVLRWRVTWLREGTEGLVSKCHGGAQCELDEQQLQELGRALDEGPAAHGFADQRWTLARVVALIEARFGYTYTLRGVSYMLERMGFSRQTPVRRSANRDEEQIITWHRRRWPAVKA
jgi:putative transposase